MDGERPKTEPLMLELRTIGVELGVAIEQSQSNDNEGAARKLAAAQARLLKQLMIANSRLQRRIDHVLNPQRRGQLEAHGRNQRGRRKPRDRASKFTLCIFEPETSPP
jgi:hypothetical protein